MNPACRLGAVLAALPLGLMACGGDRSGGPTCGMALTFGPTLVQQRLLDARAVIVDAPLGLPAALPARVAGRSDTARVLVGYESGRLIMGFEGASFPGRPGYALLVVDDTSQRAMGVLIFDSDGPRDEVPRIGSVQGGELTLPLYGVLVEWTKVSNPRCPLLGSPVAPARDS
jgi:hypothetical protein